MKTKIKLKFSILEKNSTDRVGESKGFENSLITAYLEDGTEVGYLKVTLLRAQVFNQLNPTLWDYMRNYRGWIRIPTDTLAYEADAILQHLGYWDGHLQKMTIEEKQKIINQHEPALQEKMNQSRDFFVDKPFVCFVEVKADYRGQGIAAQLYQQAHEMVQNWGMELYSDDNQTDQAKQVWQKLLSEGKAQVLGKRFKYLG